jgi:hypothetical protein
MEKTFKLNPPYMPNFISYEVPATISVADLSEREAHEYAELMKKKFIEHWESKVRSQTPKP